MENLIEKLKGSARASWAGEIGEQRAVEIETFLRKMLSEYSSVLKIDQADLLRAFEKRRDYSAINFYQASNFPPLEGVVLFKDAGEFKRQYPSGEYQCPACNGISTNPYECNSGVEIGKGKDKKTCDWKSYGLLGTAGKGLRVVLLDGFIERPVVHEIFMPIEALAV